MDDEINEWTMEQQAIVENIFHLIVGLYSSETRDEVVIIKIILESYQEKLYLWSKVCFWTAFDIFVASCPNYKTWSFAATSSFPVEKYLSIVLIPSINLTHNASDIVVL